MRLSCNGCRVLRKGCSDSCSIRPSLQWIKTPDAQSNATVFLAKFYGRAGLLNLVNAAPENLRPSVFRSLLYEACGRIVNPIYGSVGLLWSCNWSMCQAAVEAVLKGAPIVQISSAEAAAADTTSSPAHVSSLHKAAYDIRHVASSSSSKKQPLCASPPQTKAPDADKPVRLNLKKRTSDSSSAAATCSNKKRKQQQQPASLQHQQDSAVSDDHQHDSAVSDQQKHGHMAVESSNSDDDAQAAGSHVSQAEHNEKEVEEEQQQNQLGLDLTLGLAPVPAPCVPHRPAPTAGDAGCSLAGTGTGWSASEPAFRFL